MLKRSFLFFHKTSIEKKLICWHCGCCFIDVKSPRSYFIQIFLCKRFANPRVVLSAGQEAVGKCTAPRNLESVASATHHGA